jgi:hypothetical protein
MPSLSRLLLPDDMPGTLLAQRIRTADYIFPDNRPLSEDCRDLISKMLLPGE